MIVSLSFSKGKIVFPKLNHLKEQSLQFSEGEAALQSDRFLSKAIVHSLLLASQQHSKAKAKFVFGDGNCLFPAFLKAYTDKISERLAELQPEGAVTANSMNSLV